MNKKKKLNRLVICAFFMALTVVMTFTPLGYIPVGVISITTIHIATILGACILGVKYGAELIIIETMNDSYETKAALLAVKENCDLPVFVSNAYGEDGKLMTGRDLAIAFLGDVTPAEFQRDLAAAQKINPEMTEDQLESFVDAFMEATFIIPAELNSDVEALEGKTDEEIALDEEIDLEVMRLEDEEGNVLLTLTVAPDDMGMVIGRHGKIAKAIRSVVKAAAAKEDKKVIVDIA